MSNKLVIMKSKINKKEPGLLPKYFKKIGLVLMILAFVPAVVGYYGQSLPPFQ